MTDVLLAAGVLSLASAALLGWVMALHRAKPDALAKAGVKAPHRVTQLHLETLWYRAGIGVSFIATSGSLTALAAWFLLSL